MQIVDRVQTYRVTCGMDPITPVAPATVTAAKKAASGQCLGFNASGAACKVKTFLVDGYCKKHRVAEQPVVLATSEEEIALVE
jgi:hypothetical protein